MGKLKEKDVELFLLENRDFFVNHPAILAEMNFEEEKGDISSLLQHQVARLRNEQNKLTELLSNFLETGKENEILFSKIRSLILQVLDADSHEMTKKVFESSLKKDFQIESCSLEFLDQKSLINLGDKTKLNLLKSEVFTGTFNIKNLKTFFNSEKIKSAVIASFNYGEEKFGLIKFGSEDPIKYLGEADVTFVEFLRDVLAVSLKRLNHNV